MASVRSECLMGTHPEKKFVDTNFTNFSGLSTGQKFNVCVVPQGPDRNERLGRKIIITDILFDGWITFAATASNNTTNLFRLELVLDTQTNGITFDTALYRANASGTAEHQAFRVLSSVERFQTLYRGPLIAHNVSTGVGIAFDSTDTLFTTIEQPSLQVPVGFNVKTCVEIEYSALFDTGVLATQTQNSITLVAWDQTGAPNVKLFGSLRIRFVDS